LIGGSRAATLPLADLDEIRSQLTGDQQRILDLIWQKYLERGTLPQGGWVSDRELYFAFGNRRIFVRDTLSQAPLSGSMVWEQGHGSPTHYQLTPVGVMLTSGGRELEDNLVRYLEYI
jgi:hypothetical protein